MIILREVIVYCRLKTIKIALEPEFFLELIANLLVEKLRTLFVLLSGREEIGIYYYLLQ